MTEYKKFDSQSTFEIRNARLAKDPEVRDGEFGPMVNLTFVNTSRKEKYSDMWVTALVGARNADLAQYLKKGDTLGIAGEPRLRVWGDDGDKHSYELDNATLYTGIELFMELKERGFEPGAKAAGDKPARGANGKAKAKPRPQPKKPAARKIVDPDDDDFGDEEDE